MDDMRERYLDLLKKTLTGWIYRAENEVQLVPLQVWQDTPPLRAWAKRALIALFGLTRMRLVTVVKLVSTTETEGRGFSPSAHTMIGLARLDNIQFCVESVLADRVPGDLIETGVWRGGAVIFMRALLKAHGSTDRIVYAADSFEGLPAPSGKFTADAGARWHEREELKVTLESVKRNFESYGLLDGQVRFLKGFFKDTLPAAPIERLAILRLDGDMYESTMDALNALYDKVSPGGYIIVDDYCIAACREAIGDFRKARGITDELRTIDWASVFWRKGQALP